MPELRVDEAQLVLGAVGGQAAEEVRNFPRRQTVRTGGTAASGPGSCPAATRATSSIADCESAGSGPARAGRSRGRRRGCPGDRSGASRSNQCRSGRRARVTRVGYRPRRGDDEDAGRQISPESAEKAVRPVGVGSASSSASMKINCGRPGGRRGATWSGQQVGQLEEHRLGVGLLLRLLGLGQAVGVQERRGTGS